MKLFVSAVTFLLVFVPAAGPVPLSVFHRLKKLEDRILELEGLSPEYFQSTVRRCHLHVTPNTVRWKAEVVLGINSVCQELFCPDWDFES